MKVGSHASKIFFCYVHEDELLLNKLKSHLSLLRREGLINVGYDRDISAGVEWEKEIDINLNTAQIILLLISSDFHASDYCKQSELGSVHQSDEGYEFHIPPSGREFLSRTQVGKKVLAEYS
jgi:hypothetical protein